MRINQFLARATGMSRRAADRVIDEARVTVNHSTARAGFKVNEPDEVRLDNRLLALPGKTVTIMLNKPAGYVCSRSGQGNGTVYDLLPENLHKLKPVGRLDKNSSGLLLLTSDGDLANQLTHPRYAKAKTYEVELNKQLAPEDRDLIGQGVKLEDGISKLQITNLDGQSFTVTMSEGRNRQIRRTFAALGYEVTKLHRTQFGDVQARWA